MTRRHLYLLCIASFLLLVTGAVARVCQQPWAEPLEVAAARIRPGMTRAEAEAIVGQALAPQVDSGIYIIRAGRLIGHEPEPLILAAWRGKRGTLYIGFSGGSNDVVISSEWLPFKE
jgi:hypothetical protein